MGVVYNNSRTILGFMKQESTQRTLPQELTELARGGGVGWLRRSVADAFASRRDLGLEISAFRRWRHIMLVAGMCMCTYKPYMHILVFQPMQMYMVYIYT